MIDDNKENNVDVLILGGGLAGLSLAIQLKKENKDIKVSVLEKNIFPVEEAAHKVGESSVEIGAYYFAETLGLKEHIEKEQYPKFGLRFFFDSQDKSSIETRFELGGNTYYPTPSYQMDRGRLENHMSKVCLEHNVNLIDSALARTINISDKQSYHTVTYSRKNKTHKIHPRWLIDASGRTGLIKRRLKLNQEVTHKANAAWFRVKGKIDINSWLDTEEWLSKNTEQHSRWFSTNHLMGEGYWVWLIPLASGYTSIGIVADNSLHNHADYKTKENAFKWLKKNEPQLLSKIIDKEIIDFRSYKNYSYSAKEVFSINRWGLTGEAGAFLDPFYSPGSDFIALSNTFISDIISKELNGKAYSGLTKMYNQLFFTFFNNTLPVFEDQYKLFGNPIVMPFKIMWDFATYWTQLGFLFIQNKITDITFLGSINEELKEIGLLNKEMQILFRQWHDRTPRKLRYTSNRKSIDISEIPYLKNLNRNLSVKMAEEQKLQVFKQQAKELTNLAQEIKEIASGNFSDKNAKKSLFSQVITPALTP